MGRVSRVRQGISVASDGPAGAGKSTVSKALAAELGFDLLDTGAMYRSYAWLLLELGKPARESWPEVIAEHEFRSEWQRGATAVYCDGSDISREIRGASVTAFVSEVAADARLREKAVLAQREYVDKALSAGRGVVLEGRDIGTTVLPDATVKFFLTADPEARARRRALELGTDIDATIGALLERDRADSSREASPLAQAADAQVVDATDLTVAEVVAVMANRVRQELSAGG